MYRQNLIISFTPPLNRYTAYLTLYVDYFSVSSPAHLFCHMFSTHVRKFPGGKFICNGTQTFAADVTIIRSVQK